MIAAALMLGVAPDGHAQVFIMEDEHSLRPTDPEEVLSWPVNPQNGYGTSNDEFTPVGDGLLLLAALGGLYLINKEKKQTK